MQRYPNPPVKYFNAFPPAITVVWHGASQFYANQHYQATLHEGDIAGLPRDFPSWDSWLLQFSSPMGYAYNPATELRFTFWITQAPYAFALQARQQPRQVGDVIVKSVSELEDWEVKLGLDPLDTQSAPTGMWWDRLILRGINSVIRLMNPPMIRFNPEQWRNWRAWGGEIPSQP